MNKITKLALLMLIYSFSMLLILSSALYAASSQFEPLLRVLIAKGVLTEEEARQIQKEAQELEKQDIKESEIETEKNSVPTPFKGLKFRMLSYLDYSIGQDAASYGKHSSYNRFSIKRGYFRVDKKITSWLKAHLTLDVHQDDEGDYKTRLKYLYAQISPNDLGFLTNMKAEIGLGHIPWLDFEEHVNPYRCQGTMAIERAGTFNSADLGLSLRGYFGGELEDAEALTGNHHYAGKWGSWHIGVFNGAGYHSKEKNGNKVIEGRITIRPFPQLIPGFQLSYFGLYGEGNNKASASNDYPEYQVHLGFLSYENPRLIFTAQYFLTKGNKDGKWIDNRGRALWTENYSLFLNVKPPIYISPWLDRKLSVFFRYDHVNRDKDEKIASDATYDLFIGGVAIEVFHGNYIVIDYEKTNFGSDFGNEHKSLPKPGNNPGDAHKVQFVYQLKF